MRKKIIIGIVTVFFTIMIGKGKILEMLETSIKSKNEEQEEIMKLEDEIVTEVKEDVIVESETEDKQKIEAIIEDEAKYEELKKEIQKNEVVTIQKQEKVNTSGANEIQQDKDGVSGKSIIVQEEQKKQEAMIQIEEKQDNTLNNTEQESEELKLKETKEKTKYNEDATQQLIDDIDDLAKQNPSLWDKNGNKLYLIEKSESLVGQNYMSPYRKQHVAGVVLNVFPVKFLVYAIDVEKDGFSTETRYYIDVVSYKLETEKH